MAPIGAGMARQPATAVVRLLGSGRHFGFAEGAFFGRAWSQKDIAREVDLDRVDALAAEEANDLAHFIGAIDDRFQAVAIEVQHPLVAEPARGGDFRARPRGCAGPECGRR